MQCRREVERGAPRQAGPQLVCDLLRHEVPHYHWFGFYLDVPGEQMLVLGPFSGEPTEHVRIPWGRGICGQAAQRGVTFRVDDVAAQDNYLACSVHVRSEIVVPVFRADGTFIGEIDIDSHQPGAFGPEDQAFLEELAVIIAPYLPVIPRDSRGDVPE